ncbi:carbonic anhydrase [Ephemerocybe angulata]|uniref:Carbonic anhydrase n=1 Tax=Ephemerocybe angulata TaxID=980116 RepID=A0A8H6IEI9_9AGAR|nr:carbonic anhydrase [Tulosesus angulatus]
MLKSSPILFLFALIVTSYAAAIGSGEWEDLDAREGAPEAVDPSKDFQDIYQGNEDFQQQNPEYLMNLATNGQSCADSRVSEGTVFDAAPGTFFTQRNIANQYSESDNNVRSILSYGIEHLHVRHVVVMGHYGCGGVAASVANPPALPWETSTAALQDWIAPIRKVYADSQRTTREKSPKLHDPGFRALVEENCQKRSAKDCFRSNDPGDRPPDLFLCRH